MPTEYDFTLEVDYPSLLASQIQAANLSTPFLYINTVGSGSSMQVSVFFNGILSSSDQSTLNNIISSYSNSTPQTSSYMINAITNSIATDANLMTVLRAKVISTLPMLNSQQLQAIMTLLGLS